MLTRRRFLAGTATLAAGAPIFSASVAQEYQKASLALTPPMGWNSWNHFEKKITQIEVRAAADMLVASGMRDAGYIYVNIDGSWEGARDANGVLHPDANKFGDMKSLGDYIHSKGLKYGIYSSPGPVSCGGFTGSYGYEEQDAMMFASWGVDFLKYDLCSFRTIMLSEARGNLEKECLVQQVADEKMHLALLKTGRPIVYSLCQYGLDHAWEWAPQVGAHMWRTSRDIEDNYLSMSNIGFSQAGLSKYASPGHWNDPDMLEIGNGGMTNDEYRTQMSLWSILAAPLLAGNDLTKMTAETQSILMNSEVIAVDQDPLGKQGDRVWARGGLELWSKPLRGGSLSVALFNRLIGPTLMTFSLSDVGWTGPAKVRDLWKHEDVGLVQDAYSIVVPKQGVVMLRLQRL
jgi:alpha-galactosidase